MSILHIILKSGFDQIGNEHRWHPSAAGSQPAAGMVPLTLLECYDHQTVIQKVGDGQQCPHFLLEPLVCHIQPAVVRRVADIRLDPDQIGHLPGCKVGIQLGERHDHLLTAVRIQADVIEVDKRIVLLVVTHCTAYETWLGHVFLIGLPTQPSCLNQISQVRCVNEAICAVGLNPESVAADQCDVIGQAGVADGVVLGEQSVLLGE